MLNRSVITNLIFGKPRHPDIPNLRSSRDDNLYFDSLTRGTLVVGKPGVGKTVKTAMLNLDYAQKFPERPIFSLDASGSFTDEFIKLVHQLPRDEREMIERRIVFDRLGDDEWVVPMPFFSDDYGLTGEEQVQRVVQNFERLAGTIVTETPVMGMAITDLFPQLLRLLTQIKNHLGESWQITEAIDLLRNQAILKRAIEKFTNEIPKVGKYFDEELISKASSKAEKDRKTFTLRQFLGRVESPPVQARLGYYKPGWTAKEAIEKGLIVLVSGERLISQEKLQAILFTDVYSHILAQVNKRMPHNPDDKHVLLIIDEVYSLIQIPGMAAEIGKVSPQYRSRRLQIVVVIQALWQLAENLKEQIWSLGNVICFGVEDFKESYIISQQLFRYDPKKIKLPPASDSGQPIIEPDRGGYLIASNWIQHLEERECIFKRYVTEGKEEPYIIYIERTKDKPDNQLSEPLTQIKERILRRRAVTVREAQELINKRDIFASKPHGLSRA